MDPLDSLKRWRVVARWYSSGSFASDTLMNCWWTKSGARDFMSRHMGGDEPQVHPEGRNALVLVDERDGSEEVVYRW
jgi:hypothetical protein